MGLSTTDLPVGGGLPKTIMPGNHILKINSIQLDDFKFIENAYHLTMHVETEPIPGFEGFIIDKDNPDLGAYDGQIGRLKASQYAFADGQTKSGIKIFRDKSILMFLNGLCKALEQLEWFHAQDNKHDTIEEFVEAFNTEAPFKDIYLQFCVAGKEYESKSGYINYDLWLPKAGRGNYAFAKLDSNNILTYNEKEHLKKIEEKELNQFGSDDLDNTDIPPKAASDFSLDD